MKIVLATGNPGKLREMRELLAPLSIEVIAQSEFGTPEAVEDGLSFVENAIIKARNAAQHCGLPALADDSGLEVDVLHGAPGIYSARYAGADASDADNIAHLLRELDGVGTAQRSARFRCAMAFVRHPKDPSPLLAEGSWEGEILTEAAGGNGFGYDPLFYLAEQHCTAAQLAPEQKNAHSHRGQAVRMMGEKLALLATQKFSNYDNPPNRE